MSQIKDLFSAAWEFLLRSRSRLIVSHENPDGDAVASVLAMSHLTRNLSGQTQIFLPEAPAEYHYLPGFNLMGREIPEKFDCVVGLDYGAWSRTGLSPDVPENKIITVDHHPKGRQRGALNIINAEASSTCELLYEWVIALNLPLDRDLAFLILTGIMTDTGNLQYASTTSRTLEIVEQLVLAGAPLPKVTRRLNNTNTTAMLKAWAKLLNEVEVDVVLNVVYLLLPFERQQALGFTSEQYSGFASFLATIPGHRAAAFLREEEWGVVQGSLRSDGPNALNVAKVAEKMSGGGHPRASGFTFHGSPAEAWAKLKLAFQEILGDTI